MSQASRSLPGKLGVSRVFWHKFECFSVTTVDDSADSLNAKFFNFDVPASDFDSTKLAIPYYVWINTNSGVDPTPAGRTGIEVSASTNDTAAVIAAAIKTALDAESPIRQVTSVDGAVVTIELREGGSTTAAVDVDTTFTIAQITAGTGGDLGATQGGVQFSTESQSVEVKSDQTGEYVLDQINLGAAASVEMNIQELTEANLALIIGGVVGDVFTPAGGTQVTGFGEDKLYKNLLPLSGQLTLKPLNTVADDNSENLTFWRSAPLPSSINFDNEIQALSITFAAYLDPSKPVKVNLYALGNQDQDGFHT